MARRTTAVPQKIEEAIRIGGLITDQGLQLVAGVGALVYASDILVGWLAFLPPHGWRQAKLVAIVLVAASVIGRIERKHDQHHLPSVVVYYVQAPWSVVYSGAAVVQRQPHKLDSLLLAGRIVRAAHRLQLAHDAGRHPPSRGATSAARPS